MNAISRRSIASLFGLATTAAALPALAASQTVNGETPEFLALSRAFDVAAATLDAARTAQAKAVEAAKAMDPELPVELIYRRGEFPWGAFTMGEEFRDITGKLLPGEIYIGENGRRCAKHPTFCLSAHRLAELLEDLDGRSPLAKKLTKLRAIAERYEADRAEVVRKSGLDEAETALWVATDELNKIALKIARIPAKSLAGRMIKARMVETMKHDVRHDNRLCAEKVAFSLASDVLTVNA